jgi:hypothetical protein
VFKSQHHRKLAGICVAKPFARRSRKLDLYQVLQLLLEVLICFNTSLPLQFVLCAPEKSSNDYFLPIFKRSDLNAKSSISNHKVWYAYVYDKTHHQTGRSWNLMILPGL